MSGILSRAVVVVAVAGVLVGSMATEASAGRMKKMVPHGGYGYHQHYRHYYGRSNVGPAVAGAALGIIGLAAGAAAANAYERDDYNPYGYGYGYAPAYGYGGYGYAPY